MLSVLAVILPIFSLIATGWIARKAGALGPRATGEINNFVVYLALPALLFDIVANADWHTLWQPTFVAAFGLGTALLFIATLCLQRLRTKKLADATIDALNASYANTGFMGIPLALAVLGQPALIPALVSTILTVCVLFAVAIVVIEVSLQTDRSTTQMLSNIAKQLARNPLLVAPVAGTVVMLSGVSLPAPINSFLKLLGGAASPCALIALGLFLAQRRNSTGTLKGLRTVVALKLVIHPLVVWLLATHLFSLPEPLVHSAVLLAALPTGTGPFMVTQYYKRDGNLTSAAILVSTVLSLFSITAYVVLTRL
ncbi:AEC family transporter [Paenalcaligenes sp. Me131]|uniref:AEC family transporter n=1 Tax=Paenalcaligenes sp. Me131 TaxID=3392636 RepID=UPI003D27E6D5